MFGRTRHSADSLLSLLELAPDEILVVNRDMKVLYCNDRAQARVGGPLTEFSQYAEHFTDPDTGRAVAGLSEGSSEFKWLDSRENPLRVRCDGIVWNNTPAFGLFVTDPFNDHRVVERLEEMAYSDALTGAPNRRRFHEDFDELVGLVEDHVLTGMIAMLDLDNFKTVNDTYGHNTGDLLLKEFVSFANYRLKNVGTLYRIGGDEFVILCHRKFDGREASVEEYEEMLSGLLLSYTLPAIEVRCTVSMGIAVFPRHGYTSAELMRRGDIALYEAKRMGRNQYAVFQEEWDTAKKFLDIYVNMLPVLTADNLTYGYQLVESTAADSGKSAEVVNFSDFDRTLDLLDLRELSGNTRYFVNYSEQMMSPLVMDTLARSSLIVVVGASMLTRGPMADNCRRMHELGIKLALRDFEPGRLAPEVWGLFDIMQTDITSPSAPHMRGFRAKNSGKLTLASGVDTPELFQTASAYGFQLFQGFYFSKPIVRSTKDIEPVKANLLRLLKIVSAAEQINFHEISAIIGNDVALSYKLLRLINSAAIGLRIKVTSIEKAVAYLGEKDLRKWTTMLVMRGISRDKPPEIIRLSMIRAQMGEELAPFLAYDPKLMFLLGMFSLMDVALGKPMHEVLQEISLEPELQEAFEDKNSRYAEVLRLFQQYEYGNWEQIRQFCDAHSIPDGKITELYMNALAWYNTLIEDLV